MAFGNYSRVDARKSRSGCSTVSVVVFVAFSLVGIWVFMSSAVEDQELPSEDPVSEAKRHHVGTNAKQFEDISGDAQMPEEVQLEEASPGGGEAESGESAASEDGNGNPSDEEPNKMSEGERAEPEEREESVAETKESSSEQNDELLEESKAEEGGAWATQATESRNEKKMQRKSQSSQAWKLCNVTAGPDYIPCLDNWGAIRQLRSTKHYEHRERHCPEDPPTCLVSLPEGYKRSVKWPTSRDKIWYSNVPHIKLAKVKGHQNWVKESGEYLTFPGGGTQFKHGALHYIDFIQTTLPDIAWGKRSRVVLDIGCGVASFGGYLFERDVLAVSLAPKDEHEAQVQFALERGIPAISAVMGTKRLPFPGAVFDVVHCARCRVPWHIEGGKLLLELDRLLRPGGHFVWSATPVYQSLPEDVQIWEDMTKLTKSMCWEMVAMRKDKLNEVAAAVFRKPTSNECYSNRPENEPPLCSDSDEPNAAWNVPLEACVHKVSEGSSERGSKWPAQWPLRLEKPPYWLKSQVGVYKKSAIEDFSADYKHWKKVISESYLEGIGINWSSIRNVMDMRAIYGGFAAALKDLKVWVMNVVPIDSPDTLPVVYERGLIGIYHDWCESFSTYPRTYDLLHADHLFSAIRNRCKLRAVIAEVDRILRPQGSLIVRDDAETVSEIESMAKSLKWDVKFSFSDEKKGWLHVQKSFWRPKESETILSAVA